jgi:hypothetical protein
MHCMLQSLGRQAGLRLARASIRARANEESKVDGNNR